MKQEHFYVRGLVSVIEAGYSAEDRKDFPSWIKTFSWWTKGTVRQSCTAIVKSSEVLKICRRKECDLLTSAKTAPFIWDKGYSNDCDGLTCQVTPSLAISQLMLSRN